MFIDREIFLFEIYKMNFISSSSSNVIYLKFDRSCMTYRNGNLLVVNQMMNNAFNIFFFFLFFSCVTSALLKVKLFVWFFLFGKRFRKQKPDICMNWRHFFFSNTKKIFSEHFEVSIKITPLFYTMVRCRCHLAYIWPTILVKNTTTLCSSFILKPIWTL